MLKKVLMAAALTVSAFTVNGVVASGDVFAGGHAKCGIEKGRVNIIGNEFPAIQTIGAGAKACATDGVEIKSNLTKEHKTLQVPGLKGNPAEYTVAIVANSSIVPLLNEGLVRPLDDLIAKHGGNFRDNQKITINGKVMAIGFMANAQHFVYRKDLLEKAGIEPPKSYEEVLAAAKVLKDKGLVEHAFGGAYSAGWGLAQEFNNMFIGHGGSFFKDGSPMPNVNSPEGVATLEMMKKLTGTMNPDYLALNNNEINAAWKAGKLAMMQMWGSRAGPLLTGDGMEPGVADNTVLAGPLTVAGGKTPATTLWWDGWTIAANVSDEDAEASYLAMIQATDPKIMTDDVASQAVWMIDGYKPTPASAGVFATMNSGAKPYPMIPYQALLHSALGAELPDFLTGKESAEKTLADVEAAYITAAKEKGFIK
ncbi:MAG: extracellular solute-binding protein [Pseudomonadota bacterium]